VVERSGLNAIRRRAVKRAAEWMIERLDQSDGALRRPGAIYPPMMYSVMALDVLGYAADHPLRAGALRQFNRLMVDDGRAFLFQPCFFAGVGQPPSAAYAVAQSDPGARAAVRAADWLARTRGLRRRGDWSLKRPRHRTLRLGLRILQRVLPGYRRHRHG